MAVSAGNEAAVSNYISTGIIDIELEEHQIKNGKEAKWQDNPAAASRSRRIEDSADT